MTTLRRLIGSSLMVRPASVSRRQERPSRIAVSRRSEKSRPPQSAAWLHGRVVSRSASPPPGPGGGGPGVPRGTRTVLSRNNLRRTYHNALAKLADPAAPLRPTARRILLILRDGGPQRLDQLAARLTAAGRRPIRLATVAAALGELHAAGLAAVDDHDQDELTGRWTALPVARDPMLDAVELHGAHDLRHTYATWLEDAGIPARVIDELMGHHASSRGGHLGSAIGAHYRHTTPEMATRVVEAIQQRLTVVLRVAELAVERHPNRSTLTVF